MKQIPFYSEMHRFIPALLSIGGIKVAEVKVNHHARQYGESKYGLSRIYKVLLDLLMIKTVLAVVDHPTRWFGKLSIIPFLVSLFCTFGAFIQWLNNDSIVTTTATSLVFFSLAISLICLGFLCELIYEKGS